MDPKHLERIECRQALDLHGKGGPMATPEELLAVVAQVRNELTEIQKTCRSNSPSQRPSIRARYSRRGAPTVRRGADRGSRVRAGGDDGGGELRTKGLKAALGKYP